MTNNKDKETEQTTPQESGKPFTDALEATLNDDPNEARKERLRVKIRNYQLGARNRGEP